MCIPWMILLATLVASPIVVAQGIPTGGQKVETVAFCDLFRDVGSYQGKTVMVTSTFGSSLEGAIFFDDACKGSASEPAVMNAKFSGNDRQTVQAFKRLSAFLKKHKTSQARVSIIAVFRDEYASGVVVAGPPRYTLDVKQLLTVEKVQAPVETNSKK